MSMETSIPYPGINCEVIDILARISKYVPRDEFLDILSDLIEYRDRIPTFMNKKDIEQMFQDIRDFNDDDEFTK
jgi:hypothetical protein